MEKRKNENAIYIFASASNPKYRKNVLNILFLPNDLAANVRYRISGDRVNLPEAIENDLCINSSAPLYFVFIDRYAESGYEYYPIRKGHFLKSERHGDSLSIFFTLGEYCFPDIENSVQSLFLELNGLPTAQADRSDPNDGHYVIVGKDFLKNTQFQIGSNAFDRIANCLASKRAFTDSNDIVAFIRAEFTDTDFKITGAPKPAIRLNRGKEVKLNCNIRIPTYAESFANVDGKIDVCSNGALKFSADASIPLDGSHATILIRAKALDLAENFQDGIILKNANASQNGITIPVCFPDQPIPLVCEDGRSKILWKFSSVLFYIFGQYLLSAGGFYVPIGPLQIKLDQTALLNTGKGIGAVITAIGLVWMLKLFGKKLV